MEIHLRFKIVFVLYILITASLFLSGCSESENDGGISGTGSPLESYLKYGIAATNKNHSTCTGCLEDPVLAEDMEPDEAAQDGVTSGSGDQEFSRTNTQESTVDELDWLKTDGEYIFSYNGGSDINIFELGSDTGTQEPGNTIPLSTNEDYLRGLYLEESASGKQLISIADQYTYAYTDYFWHWNSGTSNIEVYDVNSPLESTDKVLSISIDGQYVSSRKIGSKLYIISQYSAHIDDYIPHPYIEEDISQNAKLIDKASLEDLLPSITVNNTSKVLLSENDCHIPRPPEEATQPTLAIVTVIDLANSSEFGVDDVQASCIAAPVSTIYASSNAVYMVEDAYQFDNEDSYYSSHVYKLDFADDGLDFGGSVTLSGQVGWNEQFRLSEYQNHLRVVTTDFSSAVRNLHRLHTVTITDSELSLNATIPNESAPAPIGKPDESIYSVRFSGDKAYIVTFRQIDPFYVLDLSDHDAPSVAGELELPGFSNYLHPFGENLVFGLGREAGSGLRIGNIKLALFDVSDMSSPQLIDELFVEGDSSYSPAEYSHTALSILPNDTNHTWRLGFAASISEDWIWQGDAYYLFEVRNQAHELGAGLSALGKISGSGADQIGGSKYYGTSYDRGVLTDSQVHYSHNDVLITEDWGGL